VLAVAVKCTGVIVALPIAIHYLQKRFISGTLNGIPSSRSSGRRDPGRTFPAADRSRSRYSNNSTELRCNNRTTADDCQATAP
jgi:hypothetical protein